MLHLLSPPHTHNILNTHPHPRSAVQDAAPLALSDLCSAKRRAPGRLTALQIEERVKGLLGVWAEWSVFPVGFLVGLQAQVH
jgi:hypothetical protein